MQINIKKERKEGNMGGDRGGQRPGLIILA